MIVKQPACACKIMKMTAKNDVYLCKTAFMLPESKKRNKIAFTITKLAFALTMILKSIA